MMRISHFFNYVCHKDNTQEKYFRVYITPKWSENSPVELKLEVSHLLSSTTGKEERKTIKKKIGKNENAHISFSGHLPKSQKVWDRNSVYIAFQDNLSQVLLKHIQEMMFALEHDLEASTINIEAKFFLNIDPLEQSYQFDSKKITSATYEKAMVFLNEITMHFDNLQPKRYALGCS
jgi:hypothetical protein